MILMLFEIYDGIAELPQSNFSKKEIQLTEFLIDSFKTFPVHRIRMRKNYSENDKEISIDVEMDSTLASDVLYNKIIYRFFKILNIHFVSLGNSSEQSNFDYYFYGEKNILGYHCSIFVDVPSRNYVANYQ